MNIEVQAVAYGSMEGTSFSLEAYDDSGNLVAFKSGYDVVKNSNKAYFYIYMLENFLKQINFDVDNVTFIIPDGRARNDRVLKTMNMRCAPFINGRVTAEPICFSEVASSVRLLSRDAMLRRTTVFEQLL